MSQVMNTCTSCGYIWKRRGQTPIASHCARCNSRNVVLYETTNPFAALLGLIIVGPFALAALVFVFLAICLVVTAVAGLSIFLIFSFLYIIAVAVTLTSIAWTFKEWETSKKVTPKMCIALAGVVMFFIGVICGVIHSNAFTTAMALTGAAISIIAHIDKFKAELANGK